MTARAFVALVLHAHLPYVRHPEHARSIEERWLFEALWESYLPLLGVFERLERSGVVAPLTVSVSPPLAAMLRDDHLQRRFEDHLARVDRLAAREEARASDAFAPPLRFYRARLREARALWDRLGGDVLGALVAHHREGRLDLITTTASHAYLPGLLPASVRAQLRLGLRSFEALTGVRPAGLWLPECAYDPRLDPDLAAAGVRYTVLDAHGVDLAVPRPPRGVLAPVLSPSGIAYFGRDGRAARDVWSRAAGYPGHADYREFHRDLGFDLPLEDLDDEIGPGGARLMTGLKLHRVTGPGPHKEPYDPARASALARAHAADFLAKRAAELTPGAEGLPANSTQLPPPILVAPFDAELFGHWWLEGPAFLEHVLTGLDASSRGPLPLAATSLTAYLERYPEAPIAEPAPSTWGEGGFGEAWTGPATARLWRHMHHTAREVQAALLRSPKGRRASAFEQSIRELMLLESSDWAFMITRGEMAEYAESRVRAHVHRARRLALIGAAESLPGALRPEDAAWARAVAERNTFLSELSGPSILDAFDPWPAP